MKFLIKIYFKVCKKIIQKTILHKNKVINDENSIDVISERITDVSTTQWLELSQEYELLKKERNIMAIAALMAFPISEGILPHIIGPEVTAVPIIIVSSVGYFNHQKNARNVYRTDLRPKYAVSWGYTPGVCSR